MSVLLARFLNTAARVGVAGAEGAARRQVVTQAKKGKGKHQKPGCTPCEAMARVSAAKRMVKGEG